MPTATVSDVLLCLIIKLTGVRRLTTRGLSIWGRHVHYDELSTGPSPSESWTLAQNRIREAWIAPCRIFIDLVRLQPQPVKSSFIPSHVSFVRVVEVREYTEFMEMWWNICEVWGHVQETERGGKMLYRAHSGFYKREYTTQQAWQTRDQCFSTATTQTRMTWKLHLLNDPDSAFIFWHWGISVYARGGVTVQVSIINLQDGAQTGETMYHLLCKVNKVLKQTNKKKSSPPQKTASHSLKDLQSTSPPTI